jgi:Transposase DDE domain
MELLGRGDPRVEARSVELFERIVSTGSLVLKTIGGTRSGEVAVQRLLSSPRLSVDTIIEASSMRTVRACAGRRVVCAQDTSEINFARWAGRKGLGPGGDGKTPGFFVHPIVAVDAEEEAVLGLVGARIWTRGSAPVAPRASREIEDKESARWIEGAHTASERLRDAAQIIVTGDQEADIWACFARRPVNVELLVRGRHDRPLATQGTLFSAPRSWPELCRYQITIAPRRIGEKARTTIVVARSGPIRVLRPATARKQDPAELELGLVEITELEPPPKGVEPVLWRLLTTLPVDGADAAKDIARLYCLRWRIEEVFRTLKSDGLKLEDSQVRGVEHLFRLAALGLAAAVRILQLVDARNGSFRPMSDVLDQEFEPAVAAIGKTREGGTKPQQNPHPQGSLSWLSWIVARYGGWNCYGKPPGPKTMAQGWKRFSAILAGYIMAKQLP